MCRKFVISLAAMLGLVSVAAAQSLTVTGSVTDPEGYPLVGATVLVKGTANGTVTNSEGRFEFNVPVNSSGIRNDVQVGLYRLCRTDKR